MIKNEEIIPNLKMVKRTMKLHEILVEPSTIKRYY